MGIVNCVLDDITYIKDENEPDPELNPESTLDLKYDITSNYNINYNELLEYLNCISCSIFIIIIIYHFLYFYTILIYF